VHGASPAELLQRADLAMYAAKRTGGGAAIYHPRIDRRRPVEAARS
jgi:predicted signal transduction protein with EAL and GGDEF domain